MPKPTVPGYTLGAVLGHGASGEVWSATRDRDQRPCAIKMMALTPDELDRAAREAAVLQRVSHEQVIGLLDTVRARALDGAPGTDTEVDVDALALVVELAAGGSLAEVVAARGHLTVGEVATALSPVAAAMADLHEQGLVHADLSPGNIMFTGDGKPMISDLGVARIAGEKSEDAYGTTGFIAPEVLDGSMPTPASDVYSIAALAWFCLTGAAPEPGTIRAPLAELAPGTPPEVIDVVTHALGGVPSRRPTCAELALTLFEGAVAEPVALAPGLDPESGITYRIRSGAHAAAQHEVSSGRKSIMVRTLVLAAVAGVVLGGVVGVGARWWQHRGSEPDPVAAVEASQSHQVSPTNQKTLTTEAPDKRPKAATPQPDRAVRDRSALTSAPATVLGALVEARAKAWRTGSASALTAAHAAGSAALSRDRADLAVVEGAHAHYQGLTFRVRHATVVAATAVTARVTADVDRSAYQVMSSGHEVRRAPAERELDTEFKLRWTDSGWRIVDWG